MIRQATSADLAAFYGKTPEYTTRALVAELDGEVVAAAGTYRVKDQVYAFSEMRGAMRSRKKDILRMARETMKLLHRHPQVVAYASREEKSSRRFLEWLGFEHFGPSEHGEVYVWTNS